MTVEMKCRGNNRERERERERELVRNEVSEVGHKKIVIGLVEESKHK